VLFAWADTDKSSGAPLNLAHGMLTSTYSLPEATVSAPMDPMAGLLAFSAPLKSFLERDEEERRILFADHPFDFGAETYPTHDYIHNYWQFFHVSFPILHRATFDLRAQCPLLVAAVIAVGAHYSHAPTAKQDSRSYLERCIKILSQV
jgi:hypothetical protein